MVGEWGKVKLRDVLSSNGYIRGPFGSSLLRKELKTEGIPVYEQQHAIYDKRTFRYFIDEDKFKKLSRFQVRENDLIISCSGTIGKISIIQKHDPKGIISQALLLLRPNEKLITSKYLYYILSSPKGYHSIISISSGSVQVNIAKRKIVENIDILCPSIEDQRSIIHILGTLDDKIELNRKMNETLEAMAQALFKSWFVDFDPVIDKALAAGNPIPGELSEKVERRRQLGDKRKPLPKDIASLFPNEFENSELGWIPKGWKATTLKDCIEILDNMRIPLNKRQRTERHGPYPYYGAASIMDYIDDFLFDGIFVLTGEDGSVIEDDGHPVLQYVWGQFWVNNHAHILKGKNGVSEEHLYLFLQQTNIAGFVTGAVQLKLNQKNLRAIPFIFPENLVCDKFSNLIEPLFSKIRANADEAITLEALRNTLLPKLISGELRVPEAEKYSKRLAK